MDINNAQERQCATCPQLHTGPQAICEDCLREIREEIAATEGQHTTTKQESDLPELLLDVLQDFEACVRDHGRAWVRYAITPDNQNWDELDALNDAERVLNRARETLLQHIKAAIAEGQGR